MKMIRKWMLVAALLLSGQAMATPPISEVKLDNGMRVLLMEAHNVPMVSMNLMVPAGSRLDPKGKAGTAGLLAAMLTDHTAKHDFVAWADLLDADAIQLGSGADRDGLSMSLTVLKESLPQGVKAFAEAALQPGWSKKRFALIRERAVAAAQKSLEEPRVRASIAADALLFGTHPYAMPTSGTVESLKAISLNDLKALYAVQWKPQGSVLAVSGDITMDELLAAIAPALKGWRGKPARGLFDIANPTEVQGQRRHVEMPTRQTHVVLNRLGPSRQDADFFPAYVLNHILGGGGFSSRLMEEVREKRGMAYSVYSYFIPMAVNGPFEIVLQTRADQATDAEKVVRDVLTDMYTKGVSGQQLEAAKANLMGSFAQKMDSNRERVGLMSMVGYYGLPRDYLQVWTQKVESVKVADLKRVARRYLDPAGWNVVTVGPQQGKMR